MRTRVFQLIRNLFLAWGILSFIAAVFLAGFTAFQIGPGNRSNDKPASAKDVRFVLNWCELGDHRLDKVVYSHISERSFTGDHLDAHAIKITNIDLAELTSGRDDLQGGWYRGDQLPKVADDAVSFACGWLQELPWFPSEAKLRSGEYYVYLQSVYYHGLRPTATEIIFIRPADKMIFYLGSKT